LIWVAEVACNGIGALFSVTQTPPSVVGNGVPPEVAFADGLRATVEWYRTNEAWWRAIQAGTDYADYVAANYGGRAGA